MTPTDPALVLWLLGFCLLLIMGAGIIEWFIGRYTNHE